MLKPLLAASALLTLSLSVQAAPVQYQVEPSHTFVRFSYSHLGLSTQLHRFDTIEGTVTLDQDAKTGQVDMSIDTTSVDTGFPMFDQHIQGEDFFDTAQYPRATFKSSRVIFDGDMPVAAEGELSIKGVTQPVTLKIDAFKALDRHPMLGKPAFGADAHAVIKRSDFNMSKNVPYVGDEVRISIALEAVQK